MKLFNDLIVSTLPLVPRPIVAKIAGKYIAGESLQDAVRTVKILNARNAMATVDVLGEDIESKEQAEQSREGSLHVLEAIRVHELQSNLSIKLTSLGLRIDPQLCFENVRVIVSQAASFNNFVRIDMEDHTVTDATLDVFRSVRKLFPNNVGIVIQSYLYRSEEDVRRLVDDQANVRLCKGIYNEPAEVAIKDRKGIQDNYLKLLKMLFEGKCYVGIATHDDVLIDGAKQLVSEFSLPTSRYEFQMLLGVRNEKRDQLLNEQYRLRIYVPFGKDWYGYSIRRLKENPQMAGHIAKAIFGIGQ